MVFSALSGGEEILDPISLPSQADDLTRCLGVIKTGFAELISKLSTSPSAISFAFPGPSDYVNGVIGDLPNLPAFRGGIPLANILKDEFDIPVFINNDGNLFALGEAMGGFLPKINRILEERGSGRRFSNLIGVTLGTGYGGGFVSNGQVLLGDNSNALEVWLSRNRIYPGSNAEETIGVASIARKYRELSGDDRELSPKDIYDIAKGAEEGDSASAKTVFTEFGRVLGDSLATLVNLLDGLIVLGGGVANSHDLFLPATINEMDAGYVNSGNSEQPRMVAKCYNAMSEDDLATFLDENSKSFSYEGVESEYNKHPSTLIGVSEMGTSKAVALGAYALAIKNLE